MQLLFSLSLHPPLVSLALFLSFSSRPSLPALVSLSAHPPLARLTGPQPTRPGPRLRPPRLLRRAGPVWVARSSATATWTALCCASPQPATTSSSRRLQAIGGRQRSSCGSREPGAAAACMPITAERCCSNGCGGNVAAQRECRSAAQHSGCGSSLPAGRSGAQGLATRGGTDPAACSLPLLANDRNDPTEPHALVHANIHTRPFFLLFRTPLYPVQQCFSHASAPHLGRRPTLS